MSARILLALACTAAFGLCWWLVSTDGKAAPVLAGEPRAELDSNAAEPELIPAGLPIQGFKAAKGVPERPPEEPSARRESIEPAPGASVEVRARLALASGERGAFAGWSVEIQTWIEATNETFAHKAFANAAGLAEFEFPGFVHVDWIRCLPPEETGLALGIVEPHVDLDPGESLDETLELEPGGRLGGRVLDERDQPLAGVPVQAYSGSTWDDLVDYQPGVVEVRTGLDGGYSLPLLPPGEWGVAVPPLDWLQIDPVAGEDQVGRNLFELGVGDEFVVDDLRVVPLHRLRVLVLDGKGAPASGARVNLQPLDLRVHGLVATAPELPDDLDLFLGRAQPVSEDQGRPWPYEEFERETGADGVVEVVGVNGTWALRVAPRFVTFESTTALYSEIDLPGPDRTVRLAGVLLGCRGLVVDEHGNPVEQATVVLTRRLGGITSQSAVTDAAGCFALDGLPPDGQYTLNIRHATHLSALWPIRLASEEQRFELRRAGFVQLRFLDTQGVPVRGKDLRVLSTSSSEVTRSPDADGLGQLLRANYRTDSRGRIRIAPLPLGQVEVGLFLPFESVPGQTESRLQDSWVLPVQQEEQTLTVDLGGVVPPALRKSPTHVGLVFDAATGDPLVGGIVFAWNEGASQGCAVGSDGRFALRGMGQPHSLVAMAKGYRPFLVGLQDWGTGTHEHEFALQRGGVEWNLTFADRDGLPLPTVRVLARDQTGSLALQLVRNGDHLQPWNGWMQARDGRLTLFPATPDPLDFELRIGGHALGRCRAEPSGFGVQDLELRLPRTLAELRTDIERQLEEAGD